MPQRPRFPWLLALAGLAGLLLLGRRGGVPTFLVVPLLAVGWYGLSLLWRRLSPPARAKTARLIDWTVFVFVGVYATAAVVFLIAGLAPALARAFPDLHDALHRWGGADIAAARGLRGLAARIATAAHGPRGGSNPAGTAIIPAGQVAAGYVFSAINFTLALLLLRLRPRDRTARLLALGMLGTAAVFNAQSHAAFDVFPGGITDFFHETFHLISGAAYMSGLLLFPNGRLPRFSEIPWLRSILRPAFAVFFGVIGLLFVSAFHGTDAAGYVAFFGVVIPVAGISSQGFRYRHAATEDERVQSRLLVWALAIALGAALTVAFLTAALNLFRGSSGSGLASTIFLVFPVLFAVIPLTLVVTLVRYRLWEVGRVINKTLVYGVMAAFITAVYVAVVVGVGSAVGNRGEQNLGLSILAAALVAAAFEPLRVRLQRLANVLVYGKRATPYEILAGFSDRMADLLSIEEILPRMAEAVAHGVGAERARIRVFLPEGGVRSVMWPEGAAEGPFDRSLTISHQGHPVGDVWVKKPPGEDLTPAEDALLGNLASQAGLALRNVRLTAELEARFAEISRQAEELRASRQRIVSAQDAAARRLERDIHDGAQQQLVALAVRLGLAKVVVSKNPARAEQIFAELQTELQETLGTLRDLARGIYPPLLANRGLAAALRAQAGKYRLSVEIRSDGLGRYVPEVEAAVYFCCLEALQNVSKHAGGSGAVVRLEASGTEVSFCVEDDGVGFDLTTLDGGSGLQNMADRLSALGGNLQVTSKAGRGTSVTGRLPARPVATVG